MFLSRQTQLNLAQFADYERKQKQIEFDRNAKKILAFLSKKRDMKKIVLLTDGGGGVVIMFSSNSFVLICLCFSWMTHTL